MRQLDVRPLVKDEKLSIRRTHQIFFANTLTSIISFEKKIVTLEDFHNVLYLNRSIEGKTLSPSVIVYFLCQLRQNLR